MRLRVLTWNLLHGRAVPGAGRDLFDEFAGALARWEWDLALLQEVPPWWPAMLGQRLGAADRQVPTSRNALLPARRAIAGRWPDLIKSNGGGCNAILVRGSDDIAQHRWRKLCVWPERRWVHAVRLAQTGVWVANLHGGGPLRDVQRAAAAAVAWAGERPAVLGGDFNLRPPRLEGLDYAGGHGVDLVYVRGLAPAGQTEVLGRGRLSDHAPVAVTICSEPTPRSPARPSS